MSIATTKETHRTGSGPRAGSFLLFVCLAAVTAGLLLAGCAAKPLETVPVKGKVVYRDRPLAGVVVTFWPVDKGVNSVEATTDKEGNFTLACPKGQYKVLVVSSGGGGGDPMEGSGAEVGPPTAPRGPALPLKYRDPFQTDLLVEVPEQGLDNLVLTLKN